MKDQHLFVFLRAPSEPALAQQGSRGSEAAPLHYRWRRNQIDLPCADRQCVLVESTAATHATSEYSVVIDNGRQHVERPPAVLAALRTPNSPPWRWPELAAELRGQPDLFATLSTAFRELVQKPLSPQA